jgi:hypothetical protein
MFGLSRSPQSRHQISRQFYRYLLIGFFLHAREDAEQCPAPQRTADARWAANETHAERVIAGELSANAAAIGIATANP